MLSSAIIAGVVLLVCGADLSGQATQPTSHPAVRDWPQTVQAAADAMAHNKPAALEALLAPSAVVREFADDTPRSPERATLAMKGSTLLGVHAYPATPSSLASDLADDLRSAGEVVPEQTRQHMIPADEATARRADATAAQWIDSVLRRDDGESHPTGVLLFWTEARKSRLERSERRAVFVVLQGIREGNAFRIKQVVLGDPLETHR